MPETVQGEGRGNESSGLWSSAAVPVSNLAQLRHRLVPGEVGMVFPFPLYLVHPGNIIHHL